MKNEELNKPKSKNRLWALTLALLTCFSVMLTAFSFSSPKTNLVLAEEVEATATQSSPESITINVTTYPSIASNKFSVELTSQDGSYTTAEEKIEDYISYEIASDYNLITVTCKGAFDGRAKIVITNIANPKVKTTCYFRYRQDIVYENATILFQRWEGDKDNREWTDNYYCYGYENAEKTGIYNGTGGDEDNLLCPDDEGFKLLKFDGYYHFWPVTDEYVETPHVKTKGDAKRALSGYSIVIDIDAFNSLHSYLRWVWSSDDVCITQNSTYQNVYYNFKTSGDFRFTKCFNFSTAYVYKYGEQEFYNLIAQWMIENPDVALFKIVHNETYTTNVYNKYFDTTQTTQEATDIETSINGEYIFNQ